MIEKYALFKVFKALRETTTEESMRSLSRKAGVGVATAKRCVDYLFEKKIVSRDIIGNLHRYKLDNNSYVTRQLKIAMTAAELSEANIVEDICSSHPEVQAIVLYGSAAKGLDSARSDIDLLLITRNRIKIQSLSAERKISRELSLAQYTMQEWRKKALNDKAYYDAVVIDGIALFGDLPVVL